MSMARKNTPEQVIHPAYPWGYAASMQVLDSAHLDVIHRWHENNKGIEEGWRALGRNGRTRCVLATRGRDNPPIPTHIGAASTNMLCLLNSEWNLKQLVEDPEYLLKRIEHRATSSLQQQLFKGVDGIPGDRKFVENLIRDGVRIADPKHQPNADFILFPRTTSYGKPVELTDNERCLAEWAAGIDTSICVDRHTGEMILLRQNIIFNTLNAVISQIFAQAYSAQDPYAKIRPKADQRGWEVMNHLLDLEEKSELSFAEFITGGRRLKNVLDHNLQKFMSEPGYFKHELGLWFNSQRGRIPDSEGVRLPVHTDKYSSACVFEVVQNNIKGSTSWAYMIHLLKLLNEASPDSVCRHLLLRELKSVGDVEWVRVLDVFKRYLHVGWSAGHFARTKVHDSVGNPVIVPKKPSADDLLYLATNPERYALQHLTESSGAPTQTVMAILEALPEALHAKHTPSFMMEAKPHEIEAFRQVLVMNNMLGMFHTLVNFPIHGFVENSIFAAKCHTLEVDFLNTLKKDKSIDLRKYCGPIQLLLRDGMTEGCLKQLDALVTEKMGTTIRGLYDDILKDSIAELEEQCDRLREEFRNKTNSGPLSQRSRGPKSDRKHKAKSQRIALAAACHVTTVKHQEQEQQPTATTESAPGTDSTLKTYKVKSSTAKFFWGLFGKSSARPSVSWKSFEAAMADLGFSIMRNKGGSSVAFVPPESKPELRPVSIHAPHDFQIEGYRSLILSRRLTRAYGWDKDTFVVG